MIGDHFGHILRIASKVRTMYSFLTAIKCAKGVKQQIIRFINIHYITRILEEKLIPNSSYIVKEYCEEITTVRVRNTIKFKDIRYFGNKILICDDIRTKFQLSRSNERAYIRIVKNGCLFDSLEKNNGRSCNCYAQLSDGT